MVSPMSWTLWYKWPWHIFSPINQFKQGPHPKEPQWEAGRIRWLIWRGWVKICFKHVLNPLTESKAKHLQEVAFNFIKESRTVAEHMSRAGSKATKVQLWITVLRTNPTSQFIQVFIPVSLYSSLNPSLFQTYLPSQSSKSWNQQLQFPWNQQDFLVFRAKATAADL